MYSPTVGYVPLKASPSVVANTGRPVNSSGSKGNESERLSFIRYIPAKALLISAAEVPKVKVALFVGSMYTTAFTGSTKKALLKPSIPVTK